MITNMEKLYDAIDSMNLQSRIKEAKFSIGICERKNEMILNTCGSCYFWMKTDFCKREKFKKVTCNEAKCEDFELNLLYNPIIQENQARIQELKEFISINSLKL